MIDDDFSKIAEEESIGGLDGEPPEEWLEERIAIYMYDGGLTEEDARDRAKIDWRNYALGG